MGKRHTLRTTQIKETMILEKKRNPVEGKE
jgi:hypothetical protein